MKVIIFFILAMWSMSVVADQPLVHYDAMGQVLSFPAREIIITDSEMAAHATALRNRAQNLAKNDCEGRSVFASRGTYTWAEMPDELPTNYNIRGFGTIRPRTNNLVTGFCQIIISAFTPEGDIWHAFFAVGDVITCGSWVPTDEVYDPFIECASGGAVLGQFGEIITLY